MNTQMSISATSQWTLLQFRSHILDCFFRILGVIKMIFDQTIVQIMKTGN